MRQKELSGNQLIGQYVWNHSARREVGHFRERRKSWQPCKGEKRQLMVRTFVIRSSTDESAFDIGIPTLTSKYICGEFFCASFRVPGQVKFANVRTVRETVGEKVQKFALCNEDPTPKALCAIAHHDR